MYLEVCRVVLFLVHSSLLRQRNGQNDGDIYFGNCRRQVWCDRVAGRSAGTLDRHGIVKTLNASLLGKPSFAGVSVMLYAPGVCYL